jgi:hypothetical protein
MEQAENGCWDVANPVFNKNFINDIFLPFHMLFISCLSTTTGRFWLGKHFNSHGINEYSLLSPV